MNSCGPLKRSRDSLCWFLCLLFNCLALSLSSWPARAERWDALADTVFQNYGRYQGLPHIVPTTLVQDRQGFIWIGTQGGLARWDGYRFHSYRADPSRPGSLPDDWIQRLFVDAGGRLWVGGSAGGLSRFDGATDQFVPIPLKPPGQRTHIGALANDGSGGLWIGTDLGLHHLNGQSGEISHLTGDRATGIGLPAGRVLSLLYDDGGTLWVGNAQGLARSLDGGRTFTAFPMQGETGGVSTLLRDEQGRLWIGTRRGGLFILAPGDRAPRPVDAGSMVGPARGVSSLCLVRPDELWVGLRGGGIWAVDLRSMDIRPIRHDRTLPNSLVHDDVWSLLRDDAGSVWVGTTGGLSYRPFDSGVVSTIFGATMRPHAPRGSDVSVVRPTRDGRFWLGYLTGGADLIDPVKGLIETITPEQDNPETGLPQDAMFAIAEDAEGRIYFATRRGLYIREPGRKDLRLAQIPGRNRHAAVTTLSFESRVLWIGGEDDGIWGIVPGGGDTAGTLVLGRSDNLQLPDPGVMIIRRGKGDDLWVGTRNGLVLVNLAARTTSLIPAAPTDPSGLPARYVSCLLFDQQGRLWVGTFGGGLAMMTGRDADGQPRFRRLGTADGLPHANVDSLQMDGAGMIWAGTDDGLALVDPVAMKVRPVRRADGAPLVDYFVGAGATSLQGEGLFGAKGGITVTKPGTLPPWRFRPPIVVTDLRVGGTPLPVAPFNHPATQTPPVMITPEANSLAVEFAALDYTSPERNLYAYRLEGYDRDWITTDASRRLAVYANLSPGTYTLQLRGSNREGLWTDQTLALTIRVLPAWYQLIWVRLLALLALMAGVAGLVGWRTAYLRQKQTELEQQIADRTADLRSANEMLEQLVMTDPLTGCANRRHFMERAGQMIDLAQRQGTPLSLAVLDLDEFKRVNDTYGHPGGDAALAMAGKLLAGHMRGTDLIGRIGGEEFALLMPHTNITGAVPLAERLRQAIEQGEVVADGRMIRVTASLGIAELRPGEDFDGLYARADYALYAAKQGGRNRVERAGGD